MPRCPVCKEEIKSTALTEDVCPICGTYSPLAAFFLNKKSFDIWQRNSEDTKELYLKKKDVAIRAYNKKFDTEINKEKNNKKISLKLVCGVFALLVLTIGVSLIIMNTFFSNPNNNEPLMTTDTSIIKNIAVTETSSIDNNLSAESLISVSANYNDYEVGDTIRFGRYQWLILEIEENNALLFLTDALTQMAYDESLPIVEWERSTLRNWLNNEFYNQFTIEEQECILEKNYYATEHKVFLLNEAELNQVFADYSTLFSKDVYPNYSWVLKPDILYRVRYYYDSSTNSYCSEREMLYKPVHPALWVNLEMINSENEISTVVGLEEMETIIFGNYEWIVLDTKDDQTLVVSKDVVAERAFTDDFSDEENIANLTWEMSSVRNWLNDEFYNQFTNEEQARIITTNVKTNDNQEFSTSGGNDTKDKIFLLSAEEAEQYFPDNILRSCDYDVAESCSWWLRTPGATDRVVMVSSSGYIDNYGLLAGNEFVGVRPAMWITVD